MTMASPHMAGAALLFLTAMQAAVPVTEEPRHKVVFANRYVRVIDAALPVGDVTVFHTHDLDNVPIVITGGVIRTQVAAGATTETTLEVGRAWFAKAAYTHQIANIGTTPLRFIDAEILSRWTGSLPGVSGQPIPEEATVVENDVVRVARVTLSPHGSLKVHAHARPLLHVEVTGGTVSGTARAAGGFTWLDPGSSHPVQNTGDRPYEAVIVEWK
jgi:quercetin dioxygenase-like cupin family protein